MAARSREAKLDLGQRVQALELLGYRDAGAALPLLASFVDNRYPAELQIAAVRSLTRIGGIDAVSASLVPRFRVLTPRVRRAIVAAVVKANPGELLAFIDRGELAVVDVPIDHRQILIEHPDERIRERAQKTLASVVANEDRRAVIETYRGKLRHLPGDGDRQRGRAIFLERCATCHRFEQLGVAVGADLSGVARRATDALLVDILDPSRAVDPKFLSYVVIKTTGEVSNGILAADNPGSIVLRTADGKTETILRRDIRELRATRKSLMPEGLENDIDPAALRDLIAFLRGTGLPQNGTTNDTKKK